jgi:hypothetical protein
MASSLFRNLKGISQNIPYYHLFKNHSVGIVVVAALSAPLLYIANADYRAWLQLGRAGLPYNLFGWLLQLTLTPLRARRFDTTCYSDPIVVAKASPPGSKSYLSAEDIPQRQGSRPSIYHWVLPHRQSDSRSSEEWKTVGFSLFQSTQTCIQEAD